MKKLLFALLFVCFGDIFAENYVFRFLTPNYYVFCQHAGRVLSGTYRQEIDAIDYSDKISQYYHDPPTGSPYVLFNWEISIPGLNTSDHSGERGDGYNYGYYRIEYYWDYAREPGQWLVRKYTLINEGKVENVRCNHGQNE